MYCSFSINALCACQHRHRIPVLKRNLTERCFTAQTQRESKSFYRVKTTPQGFMQLFCYRILCTSTSQWRRTPNRKTQRGRLRLKWRVLFSLPSRPSLLSPESPVSPISPHLSTVSPCAPASWTSLVSGKAKATRALQHRRYWPGTRCWEKAEWLSIPAFPHLKRGFSFSLDVSFQKFWKFWNLQPRVKNLWKQPLD